MARSGASSSTTAARPSSEGSTRAGAGVCRLRTWTDAVSAPLGGAPSQRTSSTVKLRAASAAASPTTTSRIGDVAHPSWRASAVGVYRLWRDLGYAVGALLAGLTADWLGLGAAIWLVAGVTAASGVVVALRMRETLGRPAAVLGPSPAPV